MTRKVVRDVPDEKMGRDILVRDGLAQQVPKPEWYPAGSFDACISRSPKQNRSNIRLACRSKQENNICIDHGWMSYGFYIPFNSISAISGRCKGEHEKLCVMKHPLG